MGTWALEFNPGLTGSVYKMVYFGGNVFAFCYHLLGAGVWQRTPPNWTRRIGAGGLTSRGTVWNDQMWWGTHPAGVGAGRYISRSVDGITWTLDIDFGAAAYSHWSSMGGHSTYLYAGEIGFQGAAGTTFQRRDHAGAWTANPPVNASEINHGSDVYDFGSYIYHSDNGPDVWRYRTAWESEPTLDNERCFFTLHGTTLYATTWDGVYRRTPSSGWTIDLPDLGGAWGFEAISVGGDNRLYVAAEDGVNSRVYVKAGSTWVLHSTAAGVRFHSAIADASGNLFAGTHDCRFYIYTSDFNLTGAGQGLYPQSIDCDGDGDSIYVGLYDSAAAQPILIKAPVPLALDTMGNAVFNPGAGDAINIKCSVVGGDLAVSGYFGANEQVETSDDGGLTWVDIDPGTWAANRAQPLAINPEDIGEVLVGLSVLQDLVETLDAGTTWTTLNAAVGYAPGALALLTNGNEMVVGNAGANRIDYSPNRGIQLTNVTGAFGGNVAALEISQ